MNPFLTLLLCLTEAAFFSMRVGRERIMGFIWLSGPIPLGVTAFAAKRRRGRLPPNTWTELPFLFIFFQHEKHRCSCCAFSLRP